MAADDDTHAARCTDGEGRGHDGRSGHHQSGEPGATAAASVPVPRAGGPDEGAPRFDGRAMAVAVTVPVLAAGAVLATDAWLGDRLGDVVATHWGADGRPDAWGGRTGFVVGLAAATGLLPLAVAATAGSARVWTALRRSLLGIAVWAALLLGAVAVVSLVAQRDGAPGAIGAAPLWLALAAVPPALLAARVPRDLVPPVLATRPPSPDLPRADAREVPEHPIGRVARLAVVDDVVTVRTWRWTPVRIPVAEVVEAHVSRSTAWDWGGWGLRHQPGTNRYAYVGSGREGVDLHRADGTRWFVTTPRADEVAGVVNTIADQQAVRGERVGHASSG